ncbi:hypothetical protein [Nocardioides panzhihuensis]|uniref:Uncharacterized protein n=1 Tax=Nocardioides panzhihuensis TaxID=860243 RepID=A0A7Z0IR50_9ACTN|nr:hypothetical protein [Nocardioides panzhihuensis]NYI76639.1 hypothetical protein [Nocardioides panzhihuensis]
MSIIIARHRRVPLWERCAVAFAMSFFIVFCIGVAIVVGDQLSDDQPEKPIPATCADDATVCWDEIRESPVQTGPGK